MLEVTGRVEPGRLGLLRWGWRLPAPRSHTPKPLSVDPSQARLNGSRRTSVYVLFQQGSAGDGGRALIGCVGWAETDPRATEDAGVEVNYPRFRSDFYRRIRNMPRQYSLEFRQSALRLLDTTMEASDISEFEAIKSVAGKVGISEESVRRWRRKAQIDAGERPDTTSAEHAEIRKLKREVAELRRANVLK